MPNCAINIQATGALRRWSRCEKSGDQVLSSRHLITIAAHAEYRSSDGMELERLGCSEFGNSDTNHSSVVPAAYRKNRTAEIRSGVCIRFIVKSGQCVSKNSRYSKNAGYFVSHGTQVTRGPIPDGRRKSSFRSIPPTRDFSARAQATRRLFNSFVVTNQGLTGLISDSPRDTGQVRHESMWRLCNSRTDRLRVWIDVPFWPRVAGPADSASH